LLVRPGPIASLYGKPNILVRAKCSIAVLSNRDELLDCRVQQTTA